MKSMIKNICCCFPSQITYQTAKEATIQALTWVLPSIITAWLHKKSQIRPSTLHKVLLVEYQQSHHEALNDWIEIKKKKKLLKYLSPPGNTHTDLGINSKYQSNERHYLFRQCRNFLTQADRRSWHQIVFKIWNFAACTSGAPPTLVTFTDKSLRLPD